MKTDSKFSIPCRLLPDGSTDCSLPPGVCVVTRCSTVGDQIACLQVDEPCATPVPTASVGALALMVALLIVVATVRRAR
jgi:hypothetical protein